MTEPTSGALLPCGRSWDDLLEQVATGSSTDAHQSTCAHCRAALAELRRVWAPVQHLAAEPVQAPPNLVRKVMDQVRAAAQHRWHALLPAERGSTRVAARVVATLARLAAARVPGVRVALGRTTEPRAAGRAAAATARHDASGSAVAVAGGSTVVELALAAQYGAPMHELAERVRTAVVHDLGRLAGLQDVQVDVVIDDVVP